MGAALHRVLETFSLGPVPAVQGTTDVPDFREQDGRGQVAAQHLHPQSAPSPAVTAQFDPETLTNSIVGVHVPDGVDYSRICIRHQRASRAVVSRALAEYWECPACAADTDGSRERYRELMTRLVLVGH